MIKKLLHPVIHAMRQLTGSTRMIRIINAPAGPVTLYPTAEASPDCTFEGCNFIHGGTTLVKTHLGRYTYIGGNCCFGSTTIGSFCSIAGEVVAGLGKHPSRDFVSTHPAFYSPNNAGFPMAFVSKKLFLEGAPVTIGHDVWVGFRAIILDGVQIGDGAIVAAGSVVSHDVEPYSIVGGVPARCIRYRFPKEIIAELMRIRWWARDITWIREHADDFSDVEQFLRLHGNVQPV